ncbi:MAG: hypothetical protein IJU28_03580 [Clostridia bacterium]|nr:hypothetical protein [Clostridia bacterium]
MTEFYIYWALPWAFIWALRALMAAGIGLAAVLAIYGIWRVIKWLRKSS